MSKILYNVSSIETILGDIELLKTDFESVSDNIFSLSTDISEISSALTSAKNSTTALIDTIVSDIKLNLTRAKNALADHLANETSIVSSNEFLNNLFNIEELDGINPTDLIDVMIGPGGYYKGNQTYTIEKGDNLTKIAEKYNISLDELIEANKDVIDDPNLIYSGNTLIIPLSAINVDSTDTTPTSTDTSTNTNTEQSASKKTGGIDWDDGEWMTDEDWANSKYFNKEEFRCKCGKCSGYPEHGISKKLVKVLTEVREEYGKPVKVVSGYRCTSHNKRVGGVSTSDHVQGKAADFQISGENQDAVKNYVEKNVEPSSKGSRTYAYTGTKKMGRSVHVDT